MRLLKNVATGDVTQEDNSADVVDEASLLKSIDEAAGEVRARFITVLPGQEMIYLSKLAEARACAEDPGGTFPLLAAEAAARAEDIAVTAARVIATAAEWTRIASAIEGARYAARLAVQAAETPAAKRAAASVDWDATIA